VRVLFGDWTLDSETRELRRGGNSVHLSPKAFRLLEVLIEQRPAAISKERLFEIVWPDTYVAESNLASVVKEIRTALQDDARQSTLIRTVFGYGYAFAGEATAEDAVGTTIGRGTKGIASPSLTLTEGGDATNTRLWKSGNLAQTARFPLSHSRSPGFQIRRMQKNG